MNPRSIILGVTIVAVSFIGATLAMNVLWPRSSATLKEGRPALVAVPPLKPLAGISTVLAPAAITMSAIGEALEAQAPRNLAGKRPGAVSSLMPDADIHWTIARGPLNVSGQPDGLVVTTPLSGAFQARGTISNTANAVGGTVGSIIGAVAGGTGQQVQNLVGRTFDQHADIHGMVMATARPSIAPNWRLTPNLAAQINVADAVVPVAGVVKLSVAREVKPFLDNAVHEQTTALETRLRNDPFIENAARNEWSKLCRSISLGAAGQGLPNLWLEVRPTHAIAAQPKIDGNTVTLFVGVRAETRIVPAETKPDCPFPEQLEIVPQANEGTLGITVPIDIPFTEVSRLVDAQIRDKTFSEDASGKYAITVKQAEIAPSGDRLLISLLVNVKRHGFFSVGADATLHVWGRPVLDQEHQLLRFTDVKLDVQSKAAFGLLGEAAQAAVPYLQRTLAEKMVIDLKPFAADAKKRIASAVTNFTSQAGGLTADVNITALRLTDIAYDAKALRVIADADGTVNVMVSSLNMQ
jgi:hypothetical protein